MENNFIEHHQTYNKINTLYKRDPNNKNKLIIGDFSRPEFEYLYNNEWSCEEKIDGTNVHWFWNRDTLEYHGKTENAQIPSYLLNKMKNLITEDMLKEIFPVEYDEFGNKIPFEIRIYGEGYGNKIQKGNNYISSDCNVRLFDIRIGKWWLTRESLEDIANKLNIEVSPLIGVMTLKEAEEYVKKGFKSTFSENKDYNAEGLVCKPLVSLYNRSMERVICKIKTCDYVE